MSLFVRLYLTQRDDKLQVACDRPLEAEGASTLPYRGPAEFKAVTRALELHTFGGEDWQTTPSSVRAAVCGLGLANADGLCAEAYKRVGRALFQALFPTERLRTALHIALKRRIGDDPTRIELRFGSSATDLCAYPWELAYDDERHGFLFAARSAALIRYIDCGLERPPLLPGDRLNVLLATCRPEGKELSTLSDTERRAITSVVETERPQAPRGQPFALDIRCLPSPSPSRPASTWTLLSDYLVRNKDDRAPHVFHFDGHGAFGRLCPTCQKVYRAGAAEAYCEMCSGPLEEAQGHLACEGKDKRCEWISASSLGQMLADAGIRLAVLSACRSATVAGESVFQGLAPSLIQARIPAVVAMQFPVTEEAAVEFSRTLYLSLSQGQTLTLAVSQARVALCKDPFAWYRPVLYLRTDDENPEGWLFSRRSDEAWAADRDAERQYSEIRTLEQYRFTDRETPRKSFAELTGSPPPGESTELAPSPAADQPAAAPYPKRVLVVCGIPGIGKATLLRVCRLFCRRNAIPVGVVDSGPSPVIWELLTHWAKELMAEGVRFSSFQAELKRYDEGRQKVEAADRGQAPAGRPLAATNPEVYNARRTTVLGSPAAVKRDNDPTDALTEAFVADLGQDVGGRVVLMIGVQPQPADTHPQASVLESWLCSFARRLPKHVLLVAARLGEPDWQRWKVQWPDCEEDCEVITLKEMADSDIQALIARYCACFSNRPTPDAQQVGAIVAFARGLPFAVEASLEYLKENPDADLGQLKAEVLPKVVRNWYDALSEGDRDAFVAAAVLRSFNLDSLRALLGTEADTLYTRIQESPFVRRRGDGYVVHDKMREMLDESLRATDAARFADHHRRAAAYYALRIESQSPDAWTETDRLRREQLYHSICADESKGMRQFQAMAEALASRFQVGRLEALVEDVGAYRPSVQLPGTFLWLKYYAAWLKHQKGLYAEAEPIYRAVGDDPDAEPKLRAYARCDQGSILARWNSLKQPGGPQEAIKTLVEGLDAHPIDSKLAMAHVALRSVYAFLGDWKKASKRLDAARAFMEKQGDTAGVLLVLDRRKADHGFQGAWHEMFAVQKEALDRMPPELEGSFVHSRLLGTFAEGWVYAGRYFQAADNLLTAIGFAERQGVVDITPRFRRDLGFTLGVQGDYETAEPYFKKSIAASQVGKEPQESLVTLVLWGAVLIANGRPEEAEKKLQEAVASEGELYPMWQIIGLYYLALAQEIQQRWVDSEATYRKPKLLSARHYFECGALAGRIRIMHAQKAYAEIPALLAEAEKLAQGYEYNDHLASLRLSQGHMAWDGVPPTSGGGFEAALGHYQRALVYALRYNRFLLEHVLSGRQGSTPLRAIVPHAIERGDEGRKMLEALRDWWQTGSNDVGTSRADSISLIPEGLPLVEAEDRIWKHGVTQWAVVDVIDERLR